METQNFVASHLPTGACMHESAFAVVVPYVPAGHAVHAEALAAEYEPAAQAVYVVADNPATAL